MIMAYKSKEKFLEKNGKIWSYCHVDPKLGKPCTAHASHVSAKDFAKTLTAAAHGLEEAETENDIMDIFDTDEDFEMTEEEILAVSDLVLGKVDREHPTPASFLIKPTLTEGYYVYLEDASSPLYANLDSLEEAREQAEIHSSIRTDGKVYIVSKFKDGKRDKEFEAQERKTAAEISSKFNIDEPERLVGQAIAKLATAETEESLNAADAIKTLTLALREMKDLVAFRPVQFKKEILLAHSVMDGSFFK